MVFSACGPSAREQDLENQLEELQAKIRELSESEEELRSVLQQAQSNIEEANSNISDVQLAAFETCDELRFAASALDEVDDVVIP